MVKTLKTAEVPATTGNLLLPSSPPVAKTQLSDQSIDGAVLPPRYEVWRNGLFRRKVFAVDYEPPVPSIQVDCPVNHEISSLEKLTGRGIYLHAIGYRSDDHAELVGIRYLRGQHPELKTDAWHTIWVPYAVIADPQKLLSLSSQLVPVRGSNAKGLSDFLTDMYDSNYQFLERTLVLRRPGWHEEDQQKGWVLGDRWIGSGEVAVDPFEHKVVKALRTKGELAEWRTFMSTQWSKHEESWILRWLLGASCASVLLRPIGERTFFLHHFAQAGGAKSTLAYCGQSVWGHPKEFSFALNRTSQTSLTEAFKYLSDFCVLFDEMQGRSDNLRMSEFIMQAPTEEHRVRTNQTGGLQDSGAKSWRLLIRTTGEEAIVGADKQDPGGQENRVLELSHEGVPSAQGVELWQWVERATDFGHAGVEFLQQLFLVINDPIRLDNLRARHTEFTKFFMRVLRTEKPGGRERQLAAIMLGEMLMLRWIFGYSAKESLDLAREDTVRVASKHLRTRMAQDHLWQQALVFLREHRIAHSQRYADLSTPTGCQRLQNRTSGPGIVATTNRDGDELWYFPSELHRLLAERFQQGHGRLIEDFVRHGVIKRGPDRPTSLRTARPYIVKVGVYVVPLDKLNEEEEEKELLESLDVIDDLESRPGHLVEELEHEQAR